MNARLAKKVHYDSGPNMTPLVDVVMVILIFLMLTGSFGAAAHFLPTDLPHGGPSRRPGLVRLRTPVFAYVSSPAPDAFRVRVGEQDYTDAALLMNALDAKRSAYEQGGYPANEIELIIVPRLSTRWAHITAVYESAMEAKWPKIGFQAARD